MLKTDLQKQFFDKILGFEMAPIGGTLNSGQNLATIDAALYQAKQRASLIDVFKVEDFLGPADWRFSGKSNWLADHIRHAIAALNHRDNPNVTLEDLKLYFPENTLRGSNGKISLSHVRIALKKLTEETEKLNTVGNSYRTKIVSSRLAEAYGFEIAHTTLISSSSYEEAVRKLTELISRWNSWYSMSQEQQTEFTKGIVKEITHSKLNTEEFEMDANEVASLIRLRGPAYIGDMKEAFASTLREVHTQSVDTGVFSSSARPYGDIIQRVTSRSRSTSTDLISQFLDGLRKDPDYKLLIFVSGNLGKVASWLDWQERFSPKTKPRS